MNRKEEGIKGGLGVRGKAYILLFSLQEAPPQLRGGEEQGMTVLQSSYCLTRSFWPKPCHHSVASVLLAFQPTTPSSSKSLSGPEGSSASLRQRARQRERGRESERFMQKWDDLFFCASWKNHTCKVTLFLNASLINKQMFANKNCSHRISPKKSWEWVVFNVMWEGAGGENQILQDEKKWPLWLTWERTGCSVVFM